MPGKVKPFNHHFRYIRDYLGLRNVDVAKLLDVSTSLTQGYATLDEEKEPRTPEHERQVEVADLFGASLDWFAGRTETPMWDPKITGLRPVWKERARKMSDPDRPPHETMVLLVRMIQETLPIAKQSWWMGGLLGLGGKGLDATSEKLARFMVGAGAAPKTLATAMQRLSDLTGISEDWIQLGRAELLDPPTLVDLGEAASFIGALLKEMSLEEAHQHLPGFVSLVKQYRQRTT